MNKINRCALDPSNVYQLILQHTSTRDLLLYKVRDYAVNNPVYFSFSFPTADTMQYGEYKVYLIRNSDWHPQEIDIVAIKDSQRNTDKVPITINGYYIISGNTIMMTNKQKKLIADAYQATEVDGKSIVVNYDGSDERAKGDLSEAIEIIQTDLLKFPQPCDIGCKPEKTRNRHHIEYKRHERS